MLLCTCNAHQLDKYPLLQDSREISRSSYNGHAHIFARIWGCREDLQMGVMTQRRVITQISSAKISGLWHSKTGGKLLFQVIKSMAEATMLLCLTPGEAKWSSTEQPLCPKVSLSWSWRRRRRRKPWKPVCQICHSDCFKDPCGSKYGTFPRMALGGRS